MLILSPILGTFLTIYGRATSHVLLPVFVFSNDVVLVPVGVGSECRRLDHELKSEDLMKTPRRELPPSHSSSLTFHSFTWHVVNGEQNSFVPLPVRMPTKPCLCQFGLLVHCHYYDDLFNLPTSLQRQGQKKEEKLG
jgi:hypothetical protein